MLDFRIVSCKEDGRYEASLDSLPLKVEVLITAGGFHPFRELLDWTAIATGGLILRDFFLVPLDLPAPAPRLPLPAPVAQFQTPAPADRSNDFTADDLLLDECSDMSADPLDEHSAQASDELLDWDERDDVLDWEQVDEEFYELIDEVEISLDPSMWPLTGPGLKSR